MPEFLNVADLDKVLIVFFVILVRTGFTLIHIGCIPTTDVNYIYIQHLLNACVTTLAFWFLGHGLSAGEDNYGVFGWNGCWLKWDHQHALENWAFVMYSSALGQMVTAGRAHILGDFIVATIISGVIHPVMLYWVWSPKGWMELNSVTGPFIDHAGSCVCHMFGGAVALAAMVLLGRRIINVNSLDQNSVAINYQATTLIGYILITLGTIVMIVHPPYWKVLNLQEDIIKCAMAFSTGMLIVVCLICLACQKFSYWIMVWAIQGGIAGIISLSGGIEGITPLMAIVYSSISSLSYVIFSTLVRATGFEDYCNILSTHLVPGALATYFSAFGFQVYFNQQNIHIDDNDISQTPAILLWQGACALMIFIIGFGASLSLYLILRFLGMLRNKPEREILEDTLVIGNQRRPRSRWSPFFRQFNRSTANLLRPGFHSLLWSRNRRRQEIHTIKVESFSDATSPQCSRPQIREEIASTSRGNL